MSKICSKCKVEKPIEDFHKAKNRASGVKSSCKSCRSISSKDRYNSNIERARERGRDYAKKWRQKNPQKAKNNTSRWRVANPERDSQNRLRASRKNAPKRAIATKAWKAAHPDQVRLSYRAYHTNRMKTDLNYRIRTNVRKRCRIAIKKGLKSGSAIRDLGCTIPEFKSYLEALFQPGMTWDNWGNGHGKWNIDHIIPLASFDLTQRDQFVQAVCFINQQPMWWEENMRKGGRQ